MAEALSWWLWVEVVGLAALPLTLAIFRGLPDRGYAFSKALGLLLVGYLSWLLASLHILPHTHFALLFILLVVAVASAWLWPRFSREGRHPEEQVLSFIGSNIRLVVVTEALFLLLFLFGALLRAYDPAIGHTEQPMDFAFLNAIMRSDYFPPHDPWLSGHTINYYYFGYVLMASLVKLSAVPASIGYNLSLALLFSLAGVGAFGLLYNMLGRRSVRAGLAVGLLAAALVVLVGNLEGFLEMLYAHNVGSPDFWQGLGIKGLAQPYASPQWYPNEFWWWWRSSRVIDTVAGGQSLDYTITEFPFFSFLISDLHPHFMALPFALLSLGLILNVLKGLSSPGNQTKMGYVLYLLPLALGLGALGFLNSWDFPTYAVPALGALATALTLSRGHFPVRDFLLLAATVLVGSLLLYLPFYLGFHPKATFPLPWSGPGSQPLHYLIFWGLFLFLGLSLVWSQLQGVLRRALPSREVLPQESPSACHLERPETDSSVARRGGLPQNDTPGARLSRGEGLALALLLVPVLFWALLVSPTGQDWGRRLSLLLPLLALLALTFLLMLRKVREGETFFALMLLFWGLALTLGVELFYLQDPFNTRMNTVFKVYYQAWVFLALAAAFGLYYLGVRPIGGLGGRLLKGAWWLALVALLGAAFLFPLAATFSQARSFAGEPDLDGLAFLKSSRPDEYEALGWLGTVPGAPVILEATGPSYSPYGQVSGRSGLPTVLGWAGHELQWRGSSQPFAGREEDVATLYRSADPQELGRLIRKYGVEYVYLGPLERVKYGPQAGEGLAALGTVAFQKGQIIIYKVKL